MREKDQKIHDEITKLGLNIPSNIFQFDLDRAHAEELLKQSLDIPFIIRRASVAGCYALDYYDPDKELFSHLLITQPETDDGEFKLCRYKNGVKTEFDTLNNFIKNRVEKIKPTKAAERWQQFKLQLAKNPEKKAAVLSIQSLDKQKIALSPDQLEEYALQNPNVKKTGDGHTGFAIAKVLQAPFAVVRTAGNRAETNRVLKDHLGNNGLLVITGHGSSEGSEIAGVYVQLNQEQNLFRQQIQRGPTDIVNSALDAGLESGSTITILLSICYGAHDPKNIGNSFAHKLAREFAKKGISSTIIASVKPVIRFGSEIINNDQITFNEKTGMAAQDIRVFTTVVESPTSSPNIDIYKPNETIQLTKDGLQFINPNQPKLQTALKNAVVPTVVTDNTNKKQQKPVSSKQQKLAFRKEPRLVHLFDAIEQMKKYGQELTLSGIFKGNTVVKHANDLDKLLVDFLFESIDKPPSKAKVKQFKNEFKQLLHSKDGEMNQHREKWKPIVANIALALTGIGLIAIMAKTIFHVIDSVQNQKELSFNQAFFFAKTKSQELNDEIDTLLNDTAVVLSFKS